MNRTPFTTILLFFWISEAPVVFSMGNEKILSFYEAKKAARVIHRENPTTLYCNCKYNPDTQKVDLKSCGYIPRTDPKRALRLEWEHVVPAEAFGNAFPEWRVGAPQCQRKGRPFKGRKCASTNPVFSKMEADLYNLWPEIGELNGLRSNFSMAELGAEKSEKSDFGDCKARIENRKFEPMPFAKGRVARVYMYMDQTYSGKGVISDKNRKLFEAWDKLHPVDPWECKRATLIAEVQGNQNPVLLERCKK